MFMCIVVPLIFIIQMTSSFIITESLRGDSDGDSTPDLSPRTTLRANELAPILCDEEIEAFCVEDVVFEGSEIEPRPVLEEPTKFTGVRKWPRKRTTTTDSSSSSSVVKRNKKSSDPYIDSLRQTENDSNPAVQWFGTYNAIEREREAYKKTGAIPRLTIANLSEEEQLEIQYAISKWEEEGCLHCHFVICFHKPKRIASVRKFLQHWIPQHLSIVKSLEAAIKYVKKDATSVTEPIEFGRLPNPVGLPKGNDEFTNWVMATGPSLCDIYAHPRFKTIYCFREHMYRRLVSTSERPRYLAEMPKVSIYWGITGSGKSTAVYNEYGQDPARVFIRSTKGKFWGDYAGQKTVIFQEYDPHKELALGQSSKMDLDTLLQVLDRFGCQVEVKNSQAQMKADEFIFTSNRDPHTWFPNDLQEAAFFRRVTRVRHYYRPFNKATGETYYNEYSGMRRQ